MFVETTFKLFEIFPFFLLKIICYSKKMLSVQVCYDGQLFMSIPIVTSEKPACYVKKPNNHLNLYFKLKIKKLTKLHFF